MAAKPIRDPCMKRVRELLEKSGLTQHELGVKMGYGPESARKSVSQFLKSNDARVSMLRRFAKAMDIDVRDLL